MSCHKYEVDFSNKVIKIHFGQGAAKISKNKVGGWKKSAGAAPGISVLVSNPAESAIFFQPFVSQQGWQQCFTAAKLISV